MAYWRYSLWEGSEFNLFSSRIMSTWELMRWSVWTDSRRMLVCIGSEWCYIQLERQGNMIILVYQSYLHIPCRLCPVGEVGVKEGRERKFFLTL